MYPNRRYFDLKVVPRQVLWSQNIYYLGTWSLRESTTSPTSHTEAPDPETLYFALVYESLRLRGSARTRLLCFRSKAVVVA